MAEQSAPWTGGTVDDSTWRAFRRGADADGVINDPTATCLLVSATGSSTEVTVSAGEAVIQGAHYILDAPLTLDVAAVGSAPAAGQTRIDLVVLRYDATQVTPADRVRLVVVPGRRPPAAPPRAAPRRLSDRRCLLPASGKRFHHTVRRSGVGPRYVGQ